ncbi:MAG: hypothetical protein WCF23_18750, partial [Candidatus Nitrosopolaris sp.]
MSIVTHYRLQIQTGWKIETLRPTERLAYEKNEPRTYGGIARNLTVEDSFTNGEFDIEIMITSDEGPYKQAKFRVTVDTIIIFIGRSISNRLLELLIHDKNCWDAQTYDEVSRLVQYRWGQQVLEW